MILPDNKWIGALFVFAAVAVLFFDIRVTGWHLTAAIPGGRSPFALAGMIIFGSAFFMCLGWYFWPETLPAHDVQPAPPARLPPKTGDASAVLEQRAQNIAAWLRENSPDCASEQKHLDEGTVERQYWHYGYLVALRDVQRLLGLGENPVN